MNYGKSSHTDEGSSSKSLPLVSLTSPPSLDSWLNLTLDLEQPQDLFLCPHCDRTLPNSQALGGHQNAHGKEPMILLEECLKGKNDSTSNYNMFRFGHRVAQKPSCSVGRFDVTQSPETICYDYINRRLRGQCLNAYKRSMGWGLNLGFDQERDYDSTAPNQRGLDLNGGEDGDGVTSKCELDLTLRL